MNREKSAELPHDNVCAQEVAVGLFSKDIKTMDDLYLHVLQDVYYAENQIKKSLPDMIEKITNRELTAALKQDLQETETQIGRLEQVFGLLGTEPNTSCPAIDGLVEETDAIASECDDKHVLDAALVAAAQAVEHYEISRYGCLSLERGAGQDSGGPSSHDQPQRREGDGQEADVDR